MFMFPESGTIRDKKPIEGNLADLALMWKQGNMYHYDILEMKRKDLEPFGDFHEIWANRNILSIFQRLFGGWPLAKKKVAKILHSIIQNSEDILKAANFIAYLASTAFSPSWATLTVGTWGMKVSEHVLKNHDNIWVFFE